MVRPWVPRAAAGFLLAVCVPLVAEQSPPRGPTAWVEVLADDAEAEALRPVVEEAVRYRLTGVELAVNLQAPGQAPRRRGRSSSDTLLERAGRAGADFALECRYSGSGSRLSLQMGWYEVPTQLMTAAVDRKGRVDLVLDTVILDALDELLDRVRERIQEKVAAYGPRPAPEAMGAAPVAALPAPAATPPVGVSPVPEAGAPAAAGTPAAFPGAAPGAPGAVPGEAPRANPGAVPGAVPGPQGPGPEPGVPGAAPAPASRYAGARLLIAPSLAPFVAVGAASFYFPLGYQSVLHVDFLPARAGGRLGLGALVGVTAFQAEGSSESGLGFLVPMGLSLRYSMEMGPRLGLLFQLAGGASVLVLGTDSQGSMAKVLPYARSGVGVELALSRSLSLGVEAAYEVHFESPYLIMGFAPGLCLGWRL